MTRIALVCQFTRDTAEGILMAGRERALTDMGYAVRLVVHPFKRGESRRPLALLIPVALWYCLRLACWRPRVVFVQKLLPLGLVYTLVLRLYGLRVVVIADDWESIGGHATIRRRGWLGLMVTAACEEAMARLAWRVWAVSMPLANRWPRALYHPNGGDDLPLATRGDGFQVCHVGTYKDTGLVELLVELARRLDDMAVRLVYAGGGVYADILARRTRDLENVYCTGQITREQAHVLISESHAGILHLSHNTMLVDVSRSSTKLWEYMAGGCVPICAAVGEPMYHVDHERTGLLTDGTAAGYERAVVSLLRERGLCAAMGARARERFEVWYSHRAVMGRVLRELGEAA